MFINMCILCIWHSGPCARQSEHIHEHEECSIGPYGTEYLAEYLAWQTEYIHYKRKFVQNFIYFKFKITIIKHKY